ncbi:hypothetical protein QTP70_021595 [Hemibagrus guttatus]|uniref:Uncharacterized protein n=1 Tax=Hemibagrus guttatus TaxID=175788 RepID=A0AAE0Q6M4_9TELE|nr:hypothetical protein QTP70_021595 [Hemibagrus guttatus]KAK3538963.1 hypothetical protein QTP86_023568 [Hemibagrus guttatus]
MTAGTVVITGGIIAAVILLTIVTVLCCCRLQSFTSPMGRQSADAIARLYPLLPYAPTCSAPHALAYCPSTYPQSRK